MSERHLHKVRGNYSCRGRFVCNLFECMYLCSKYEQEEKVLSFVVEVLMAQRKKFSTTMRSEWALEIWASLPPRRSTLSDQRCD